jgi:hypothetical protein
MIFGDMIPVMSGSLEAPHAVGFMYNPVANVSDRITIRRHRPPGIRIVQPGEVVFPTFGTECIEFKIQRFADDRSGETIMALYVPTDKLSWIKDKMTAL